ncbi:hypothetical protein [Streptomyces sp. NPDC055749]
MGPGRPVLCGFLFTGQDRIRLYLATEQTNDLIAADVQLTGALAALPSPIGEKERWVDRRLDPHCVHTVDPTAW